jgi:hypothetical protein
MFRVSLPSPIAGALALALSFVLAPCSAAAAEPATGALSLTLDKALALAQLRSRLLAGQDAAAAAAREMALAAGQLPDPTLKAGVNNLPLDGADRFSLTRDFMTMRSVGVMQEFTRHDKRKARSARFEREAGVAEAGRAVALANLRRDTAVAWLDRHYQERMRELLQLQRAEAALQVEAADAAYRGGRGPQADVFASRSAVALIDDRILQMDIQVATASTKLARWVGPDAAATLAPPPDLAKTPLQSGDLETHVEHHPQVLLMASQEAVARAEADVARSNKQSDWSVELMVSQRGSAYSNMVSLNVCRSGRASPRARTRRGGTSFRRGFPPASRPATSIRPPASKILYYHDPMVPGNKFDKPAKSPVHGHDAGAGLRRQRRRRQQGHGQPAHPAEPGAAHGGGHTGHTVAAGGGGRQHRLERARPGHRAGACHRLCRAPVRPRHAGPRGQGPAAGRAVRAGVDRRAGRVPVGARMQGTDLAAWSMARASACARSA